MQTYIKRNDLTYTDAREGYWCIWTVGGQQPSGDVEWDTYRAWPMQSDAVELAADQVVRTYAGYDRASMLHARDADGLVVCELVNHLGQIRLYRVTI